MYVFNSSIGDKLAKVWYSRYTRYLCGDKYAKNSESWNCNKHLIYFSIEKPPAPEFWKLVQIQLSWILRFQNLNCKDTIYIWSLGRPLDSREQDLISLVGLTSLPSGGGNKKQSGVHVHTERKAPCRGQIIPTRRCTWLSVNIAWRAPWQICRKRIFISSFFDCKTGYSIL